MPVPTREESIYATKNVRHRFNTSHKDVPCQDMVLATLVWMDESSVGQQSVLERQRAGREAVEGGLRGQGRNGLLLGVSEGRDERSGKCCCRVFVVGWSFFGDTSMCDDVFGKGDEVSST